MPPSVDAARLRLNMDALKRYHRVGAMSSGIVLEYQGDTTDFTPDVSGINADGSAIASRAGVLKKADKSKPAVIDPLDIPRYASREFGKPVVVHRLNKPEMAQNISDGVCNRGQTREEAWAQQIDASLRDSFRRAGRKHLKRRADLLAANVDYVICGAVGAFMAADAASGHVPISGALAWAGGQGVITGVQAAWLKRDTGSTHLSEKRWSLLFSQHQPDRYLALKGLSRVYPLVSTRS